MTSDPCPREAEVLRSCASGDWPADLHAHVETCDDCRDLRAVALFLQDAARADDSAPLPDAADIWWRGRLLAERDARERAMRPLDTLERSEPLIVLVAVVTLLVLRGEFFLSRLAQWASSDATGQMLSILPPAILPLLIAGFGLCGLVLLVGLGAVLAND
jgi:hypothetical protein